MTSLAKTFEPGAIESRWYQHWEDSGQFRPVRSEAAPFTIVMPPPNVTGSLHIGHALDISLQDILVRHARMQGKDALWVVGTDHAGIATQMVVERNLESQGIERAAIGREAFLDHVWEWKAQSGGAITRQLRRLGASCDWSNERFTMDEGFSRAVVTTFVEMYRRGLIYRDKRLVNWDPKFQSAISDLEVDTREVAGKFWHLRYKLADGGGHILVATTRPETMLADMAVAVHPDDERYRALLGKKVRLPLTGRLVEIIADEHADPELGSGAVKITPGHDFNDHEVGKRAGIRPGDMLNMFDGQARIVQTADGLIPAELLGLDRFEARALVVELLDAQGALERVEERIIATPFGDRSGAVIEPWLTDQWYVDAGRLAGPAIEAVNSGAIRIVPESWTKTWFNWLENIQPWCVSRQLWWGHRIPAWYGPTKEPGRVTFSLGTENRFKTFVAESFDQARSEMAEYYGIPANQVYEIDGSLPAFLKHWSEQREGDLLRIPVWRDEDVLDTWFSSALWPFATLGWPDDAVETLSLEGEGRVRVSEAGELTKGGGAPSPRPSPRGGEGVRSWTPRRGSDLARHYPNDVLISGFDILFFWDARMAMQGIELMGRSGELPLEQSVPWRTLYLHGLVRDAAGQKMSKSKGNTVDPLGLIDRYGADALRFTLAAMESQGRDIKLDEKRVEGYRNFATKLWNAARFLQGNGIGASASIAAPEASLAVNRWIIGEVVETLGKLDKALADLRFDEAANAIYHFVWDRFCDWYVELIKPVLSMTEGSEPSTSAVWAEPVEAPSLSSGGEREKTVLRQAQDERGQETRRVAAWAFDQILVMLHPFMPFVTEELWHSMAEPARPRPYDLIVARWPDPQARRDAAAASEIGWLIDFVGETRAMRTELNVPWSATLSPTLIGDDQLALKRLEANVATLSRLVKLGPARIAQAAQRGSAQIVVEGTAFAFPLEDHIDLEAERVRLTKAIAAAAKERDGLAARLANPAFTERAKPEAVDKARADHALRAAEAERLGAALGRLG